jgi:mono/diheme cytochrome c family protein
VKPIFVAVLGMLIFAAAANTTLHAQVGKGTSAGVYTTQQASRGAELYQSKCSTCHGTELAGDGTAPPLAGPAFATHWAGQPVASLFDMIHLAMPSDQPGTLTGQQTADLIAFLLSSNKFPAGQTELPAVTDHLQEILIDTAP